MNERIEKLFEQALEEFKAENKYATIIVPNPLKEKFAELIVAECLAQVARVDNMLEDDPAQTAAVAWVASSIAEHFGVKE